MPAHQISLGVIGLAPGNGHPYSWSAIFNGYDATEMANCPFPSIPAYLGQQLWPSARISGARVSHIHAPEAGVADAVARCANIPNVCGLEELSEAVDAVLLARDDAENHFTFANRALNLGKPVYIDKPVALSRKEFEVLLDAQSSDGQIFSCSAFSLSPEFSPLSLIAVEEVSRVRSVAPKDWERYGMHAIEPVVGSLWRRIAGQRWWAERLAAEPATLIVRYEDGLTLELACSGSANTSFCVSTIFHDGSNLTLVHVDTFSAFKAALERFLGGVLSGRSSMDVAMVGHCVDLLEAGG